MNNITENGDYMKLRLNENNDNVQRWRSAVKRGAMLGATSEDNIDFIEKCDARAYKINDELMKRFKDIRVPDPSTGEKVSRKPYTESCRYKKMSRINESYDDMLVDLRKALSNFLDTYGDYIGDFDQFIDLLHETAARIW